MNTKEKYVGMFWGAVLIVLGAVFLITGARTFTINDPWLAIVFTGGLSLAFFTSYYLSGLDKWGWLFPASIFAGITLVILLAVIVPAPQGGWIAAPVLLSIGAPFLVPYFQDREKNRWALIPAYVLFAVTLIAAVADVMIGELMGTFVLLLVALPFLAVYLLDRSRKWALIPFGVLLIISLIPALASGLAGMEYLLPVILIAGGAAIIFFASRRRLV